MERQQHFDVLKYYLIWWRCVCVFPPKSNIHFPLAYFGQEIGFTKKSKKEDVVHANLFSSLESGKVWAENVDGMAIIGVAIDGTLGVRSYHTVKIVLAAFSRCCHHSNHIFLVHVLNLNGFQRKEELVHQNLHHQPIDRYRRRCDRVHHGTMESCERKRQRRQVT